jgi:hypothetical protein
MYIGGVRAPPPPRLVVKQRLEVECREEEGTGWGKASGFLFLFFCFCFGFFYAVAALVIITAVALRNNAGVGARRRVSPINCGADSVPGWKSLHGA